ncbi:MAG: UDP-3-O-(3-hydroxymyristoyl)glucosamine N-acyltransferase [Alphaproteobacteria bacterium]
MADPRFFRRIGPFRLSELVEEFGIEVQDGVDLSKPFEDVASLQNADVHSVALFHNTKYKSELEVTKAGACLLKREHASLLPEHSIALICADPHRVFAKISQKFYPTPLSTGRLHPKASVDETAILGENVEISAGAVIEANAKIGANTKIGANSVVSRGVELGDDCEISANVTLSHCLIGNKVAILPGTCIGQRGFGFAMGPEGHEKVPQLGRVIIEDTCEIGSNVSIDRGAGPDTILGAGTMVDNLVQIAHNVQTGKNCVIVALSGVAGSTELGDFVVLAADVTVAGHLKIATGSTILAGSGVMRDTNPGDVLLGTPAIDKRMFFKREAFLTRQIMKAKKT